MRITHLSLKNWRNFKSVDIPVGDRLFIIGPNASGKSNLLDALRFLRDVAGTGGGLEHAVTVRGGLKRVRCLAARNFNYGRVGLAITLQDPGNDTIWGYELHFAGQVGAHNRPAVKSEIVKKNGEIILERPSDLDRDDRERLTQTALEQVNSNRDFRGVVDYLTGIRYLHLVPQNIRDPEPGPERGRSRIPDPFGRDFLVRIAETPEKSQTTGLRRVNEALRLAVPQIEDLELTRDGAGTPHLRARYLHWREHGAHQDERDFSDGTLRLIGLLWMLQEKSSRTNRVVLLEEPELSLHTAVVRQLPALLSRSIRYSGIQVILSTHSVEILKDPGLGIDEVVVLRPDTEGTTAVMATDVDRVQEYLDAGLNLDEILEPLTRPAGIEKLPLLN